MPPTVVQQLASLNNEGLRIAREFITALQAVPAFQRPIPAPLRIVRQNPPLIAQPKGAYFVCSTGGVVSFVSPALLQWLGTTASALKDDGWFSFVDGNEERKRIGELWLVASQTGQAFSYTVRCRTAKGRKTYAYVKVGPYHHPVTGALDGFLGLVHPHVIPARLHVARAQHTA